LEVQAATQAGANATQAATHAGTWSTMVAAQRRTRRRHVPRPCLRRNDPLLTTCPKATRRYLSPMMSTRSTTTLPPTPRRRAKSKPSKKRAVKKTRPEPRGALEEDTARCSPRVLRLASTDQFPASVSRKQGAKFRTPDPSIPRCGGRGALPLEPGTTKCRHVRSSTHKGEPKCLRPNRLRAAGGSPTERHLA
jgi:hypothetical protein